MYEVESASKMTLESKNGERNDLLLQKIVLIKVCWRRHFSCLNKLVDNISSFLTRDGAHGVYGVEGSMFHNTAGIAATATIRDANAKGKSFYDACLLMHGQCQT